MSGHNKWAQIKHKKAATDAKRSKLFSMLSKQITVQSRAAGGDVNSPNLRAAIERAREYSMPSDNIEKAIKKGSGTDAGSLQEVTFEAYGPGGVALIIEAITDNNNRTSQELKHLIGELGGTMAAPGAASWAFEKKRSEDGGMVWEPTNPLDLTPEESARFVAFMESLEEHDDVREVFPNASLTE